MGVSGSREYVWLKSSHVGDIDRGARYGVSDQVEAVLDESRWTAGPGCGATRC